MNHLNLSNQNATPLSPLSLTDHGGQVFAFAKQHDIALTSIVDFSANINPNVPNINWQKLTLDAQQELIHYPPEVNSQADSPLKPLIAKVFALNQQHILLGNGISEMIHQIFQVLQPTNTFVFAPAYSEYLKAAKCGHLVSLKNGIQDLAELKALQKNDVIVLVNPSTPQGQFFSPESLKPLLTLAHQKRAWLLIDESFLPFISLEINQSVRQWLEDYPHLMILQSLTKFYACPGIRIGAVFCSHPRFTHKLSWIWNLSTLDRLWLTQALQDPHHLAKTDAWLQQEKEGFVKNLQMLSMVAKVHSTAVNFVQVTFNRPVKILQEQLLAITKTRPILIRQLADPFQARLAIKSAENNTYLIDQLTKLDTL